MSQYQVVNFINSHPSVPTSFVTNFGTAVPAANILNVLGTYTLAGADPVFTTGSGNTLTVKVQLADAAASSVVTNAGLASFNSADFTVDANGFVTFSGAGATETLTGNTGGAVSPSANNINVVGDATTITIAGNPGTHTLTASVTGAVGQTITGDSGGALSPTAGNWNIFGGTVVAGTSPVKTAGAASTLTIDVQRTQAIAATDATKIGLAAFNNADFTVDANGFVSASAASVYISMSPFIVGTDTHSGYATIQAAITAAVAAGATATTPQNVYIKPKADGSAYSESLTLASGVNLVAFPGMQQQGLTKFYGASFNAEDASVRVTGLHTLPTGGNVRFYGIAFNGVGTIFTGVNTPAIYFENCSIIITGSPLFSLKTGGNLYIHNCLFSTTENWIAYFNDSSTYNIQIQNSDIQEGSITTTLGTNANVVYDISNSNYRCGQIDATNAATFGFALRDSYLINGSAFTPFIIGASTGMAGQIPGIYFNKVTWNMTGLDSANTMFTNGSSSYVITLEDCYLRGTGGVVLDNSPFPTAGANRYINCKVFYGNNGSFYVADLLSGTSFGFNGSMVFHGFASIQTANASATEIYGAPIQAAGGNNTLSFWGTVTGSKADYSDVFVGQFMVVGSRVGAANITITTPMINISTTSTATMTITADTAAQTISLKVAGIVATTYNWTVDFYIQFLPGAT